MAYVKPTVEDLDKLFEWILNFGRFKLDEVDMEDYSDFQRKMRAAHYDIYHGHINDYIWVDFNEPTLDGKTSFRFRKDKNIKHEDIRVCNFDRIVKHGWNRLKKQGYVQLELF